MAKNKKKQNHKIEQAAANAIREIINRCDHLDPDIYDHDKRIIWDGYIHCYRDDTASRASHVGRVPLQVKGCASLESSDSEVTWREELNNLQNYLDEGGILYFVGEVNEGYVCTQVYYAALMPHDLLRIIAAARGKGSETASFQLQELPNDKLEVGRIIRQFLDERKRQAVIINRGLVTLEELEEKGVPIRGYSVHFRAYKNERPEDYGRLLKNQFVYVDTDFGDSYPLEKIADAKLLREPQPVKISSGDAELIGVPIRGEGDSVSIGPLKIDFGEKGSFTFEEMGSFRERLGSWRLMEQIAATGEIQANGMHLATIDPLSPSKQEKISTKVEDYRLCCELLDVLHIPFDWDPVDLSEEDILCIGLLIRGFVERKDMRSRQAKPGMRNFSIRNGLVKVFAEEVEDGIFRFIDPLKPGCVFAPSKDGSREALDTDSVLPVLLLFSEEDFRRLLNLDHALLERSIANCISTSVNSNLATDGLLRMLAAYDKGALQGDELLRCCEVVAAWLDSSEHANLASKINHMQVIKRLRGYTDEEIRDLERLIADNYDNRTVVACADILLGHFSMAQAVIQRMDDSEKADFCSWPICNLIPRSELA